MLRIVLLYTKGILKEQHTRRQVKLYIMGLAVIMVFLGALIPDRWSKEHWAVFGLFWLLCGWLTITGLLLACFDILLVRAAARRVKRRMEEEYLSKQDNEQK